MAILTEGPEKRYAKALFELAVEAKSVDKIRASMAAIASGFAVNDSLKTALNNPAIATSEKLAVVQAIAKSVKAGSLVERFIALAAQKGRLGLIPGMAWHFEQMAMAANNEVAANVVSAAALSKTQKADIEKFIKAQTGAKSTQINEKVDESLLTGFCLTLGSVEYDQSAKGKLQRLRNNLVK